jgi:NAD+ synthase (glutamine-hydrolysing)
VEKRKNISQKDFMENLYEAVTFGLKEFFSWRPNKKVVIGLSGGVDSALVVTLLAKTLGKENVYAVNMPSHFNSNTTKNLAKNLAKELGINYAVIPIEDSVQYTKKQLTSSALVFNPYGVEANSSKSNKGIIIISNNVASGLKTLIQMTANIIMLR